MRWESRLYAELTLRCGPEKVRFVHVKGHSGHKWNDVADRLAERGKSGELPMGYEWTTRDICILTNRFE